MEYYYAIKKPQDFRYKVMMVIKECLLLQISQEKLELIRQAKKDIITDITKQLIETNELIAKLENILIDEELKKELLEDIKKEKEKKEREKQEYLKQQELKKEIEEQKQKRTAKESSKKETTKKIADKKTEIKEQDINLFEYTLNKIEQKLFELKNE